MWRGLHPDRCGFFMLDPPTVGKHRFFTSADALGDQAPQGASRPEGGQRVALAACLLARIPAPIATWQLQAKSSGGLYISRLVLLKLFGGGQSPMPFKHIFRLDVCVSFQLRPVSVSGQNSNFLDCHPFAE